jgi:hypothetical protein
MAIMAGLLGKSCDDAEPCTCSFLVLGEHGKVSFQVHDAVLAGYYNEGPDVLLIDMDGDGTDDFMVWSELWGSPGMGMIPSTGISCLNEGSFLSVLSYTDTTFIHRDTTISDGRHPVEIYFRTLYTCERMDRNDVVGWIRQGNRAIPYSLGDTLFRSGDWASDTLQLTHTDGTDWPTIIPGAEDTVYYEVSGHISSCHNFPGDEIAYIGVKKETGSGDKLGWIKLSITDNYRVSVIESALQ